MDVFDDPRSKEADRLAFEAERLARSGDELGARKLYARAAELEAELLNLIPADRKRTFSLFAVSTVATWFKAGQFHKVEALARRLLQQPERLLEGARRQLAEMRERAPHADNPTGKSLPAPVFLDSFNLATAERRLCQLALEHASSIAEAAKLLGITRHALTRRIKKYRLAAPELDSPKRRHRVASERRQAAIA